MKKTIAIVLSLTVTSLLALLATTQMSRSDEWPLKDGRYTTDPSFCAYDGEQILGAFGDAASLSLRTFKNGTIDFHYESTCRIEDVKVAGSDLLFTKVCSAEGEEFKERTSLVVNSPTSFTDGQTTFNFCGANEAASFDADAIYSFQVSLNFLGFNAGAPDGQFGPRTRQAMNAFQSQNGLPVTAQPNAETLKAALDAEMAIYEGSKPIEPEKVEPSAGDGEASPPANEATQESNSVYSTDYIEKFASRNQAIAQNLEKIRTEYASDPEDFFASMDESISPFFLDEVTNQETFSNLLLGSIPHIGCAMDSSPVVGFYNVGLHIWFLVWISESNAPQKTTLTTSFYNRDYPEKNDWLSLLVDAESGIDTAIKRALSIQTESFHLMFPHEQCASKEDLLQFFNEDSAAYRVFEYGRELRSITEGKYEKIIEKNFNDFELMNKADMVPILASHDDEIGELLLIFAFVNNPRAIFVQSWMLGDQNIEITGERLISANIQE
jgi:hypothetical protein